MTINTDTPSYRYLSIFIRVFIGVFAIALIANAWLKQPIQAALGCNLNAPLFTTSNRWHISDSDVSAQIVWEVSKIASSPSIYFGYSATGMPVSHGILLYSQLGGGDSCDTQPIVVAVDTSTGEELWRFRHDQSTHELFAVEEGFVFVNVSLAAKVDFQGNVLWEQTDYNRVPFRDFTTLTELDGSLFFPTDVGLVQLSTDTGEYIRRNSAAIDVFTLFDQFSLEFVSDTELQLVDTVHNNTPLYTLTFPTQYSPIHRRYPFVVHFEDYLLIYFSSERVEVRDFETGEMIWELEQPMYGTPTLLGDFIVTLSQANQLEIRSLETGEMLGYITLSRETDAAAERNSELAASPLSLWIASDGDDTIFIRQVDTAELLAIQIDLPD